MKRAPENEPSFVELRIPGFEPVRIDDWNTMDAAERKLAVTFAVASRMGVAAGVDLMTLQHLELCQDAPNLAPLAETVWPHARRAFVKKCASRGFVFSDEDRACVAAEVSR